MQLVPTPKIWKNGELIDWADATTHVATHSLHYGTGVYEGIRAYKTDRGPAMFRLTDHMVRFHRSAKILGIKLPYDVATLVDAVKQTVRSTGLDSCYVRPLAYLGYGYMDPTTHQCPVDVVIICWPWEEVEGFGTKEDGVRLKISSWQRHDHNTMPPAAKTTGGYVTASLAKAEAINSGYDDCIFLNRHGYVAEVTTENVFVVQGGEVLTPPPSAGALQGLTQNTVRRVLGELGIPLRVAEISRTDLYIADEAFVCGTASEITGIASVDDRELTCLGPISRQIMELYTEIVHGRDDRYLDWNEAANG